MFLENLEPRRLLTGDFQNPLNQLDVNDDGFASPVDVLLVINHLNEFGPSDPAGTAGQPPFLDTSGDDRISPIDALLVINILNFDPVAPVIIAALENDTSAEGPNQDSVTSDPVLVGRATDAAGVRELRAQLDGADFVDVAFDKAGRFRFDPGAGLPDGSHTVRFEALDGEQNVGTFEAVFVLDTTAPTFTIVQPQQDQTVGAQSVLNVDVPVDPNGLMTVSYRFDDEAMRPLPFNFDEGEFQQLLDLTNVADGPSLLQVYVADVAGNQAMESVEVVIDAPNLSTFQLEHHTPTPGALEVGSTFRPRIFFTEPVDAGTLNSGNFFATARGEKVAANVVTSADGMFAWLFFAEPVPSATKVSVTVDGSSIVSKSTGRLLDAESDGTAGDAFQFEFTTVSLTPLPGTSLKGRVVDPGPDLQPMTQDDFDPGPDGLAHTDDDVFLLPIEGLEVSIIGVPGDAVVTDEMGYFEIAEIPTGNIKVVINGLTATSPPDGFYYPEMVMDSHARALDVNYVMDMKEIYLPRLLDGILETVDASQTTTLVVDDEGAPDLTPLERSKLTLEIQPGSLVDELGNPIDSAQIGISTVPPELVRDMLPIGVLQHTFDITIQALGVAAFKTPAPITFPNVFDAAPGEQLNYLSFDHTTGRLVIEGTVTVSADGLSASTGPGSGITHPGWHGMVPQGSRVNPCAPQGRVMVEPRATFGVETPELLDPEPATSQFYFDDDGEFTLVIANQAKKLEPRQHATSRINCKATALIVDIQVEDAAGKFLTGLTSQRFALLPQTEKKIPVSVTDLIPNIASYDQDQLLGAKMTVTAWKQNDNKRLLIDKTLYYYRFLDVADDTHHDGVIAFAKTTNDGEDAELADGTRRMRSVKLVMEKTTHPTITFTDTDDPTFASETSDDSLELTFDPSSYGKDLGNQLEFSDPTGVTLKKMSTRGDAVAAILAFHENEFLAALANLARDPQDPLAAAGASAEERQLIDTAEERTAILEQLKQRLLVLTGPFVTAGEDRQSFTLDDGGFIIGTPDQLAAEGFAADQQIDAGVFLSGDRQLAGGIQSTTLAEASLVDLDIDRVFDLVLHSDTTNSAERAYIVSEALNALASGRIEVYLDQFFALADYHALGTDALVNAVGKTILHEMGHQVGLVHTSTNFQGQILGFKFEDANANGIFDPLFEQPLAGVRVDVTDGNGDPVASVLTDSFGEYYVAGLEAGTYTVTESLESLEDEWFASTATAFDVAVEVGETAQPPNFGNYRQVQLAGHKYEDINGNGQLDPEDRLKPMANWKITLSRTGGGIIESVTTDANGFFEFKKVIPGEYTIEEEARADFGSSRPTRITRQFSSGQVVDNLLFLNYELADIHGTKYFDANADGSSLGDSPLGGVTITLNKPDNTKVTTTTAADGTYAFSDLPPGRYTVSETVPSGYLQTFPFFFGPAFIGNNYVVDLQSGTDESGNDFGNYLPAQEQLDFGDAPGDETTPRYPTLLEDGGAAHIVQADFFLGASVDGETDGQPTADADGDDADGDDEDGISFLTDLIPGQTATIQATASLAGKLDAFIDLNGDGDWSDPFERVLDAHSLQPGSNSIPLPVPVSALASTTTFARFRLSSTGGLPPTGGAPDGEVEDYQVQIGAVDFDFGDAPDGPYDTTAARNGPRHLIVSGMHLGSSVDAEADATSNSDATADDASGDDEDGVVFEAALVPGQNTAVTVTASMAGLLDAFIDFNNDGDFDDAGEQLFASETLTAGANILPFHTPLSVEPDSLLISRFRYSSTGGLGSTGAAADGEVEDHGVAVAAIEFDYGDAPASFPTAIDADGARHIVTAGIRLGAAIDAETNGQASSEADGDDASDTDDEDGIIFVSPLIPGRTGQIIANSSADGKLDAWLDFNNDGQWSALEQILSSVDLAAGDNLLSFPVPTSAAQSQLISARFRFSSSGNLSPAGLAVDGEVEDYRVPVLATPGETGDAVAAPVIRIADGRADRDIMSRGLDHTGVLTPLVSGPALRLALGLNWDQGTADKALGYLTDYLDAATDNGVLFDSTFQTGASIARFDGPFLLVQSADTRALADSVDFGTVAADGAGGASSFQTLVLTNAGNQPLEFGDLVLQGVADGVSFSGPDSGTSLPPGASHTLHISFDPLEAGEVSPQLVIGSNATGGAGQIAIIARGAVPAADISVETPNNNLGGHQLDEPPVTVEDFATIQNRGLDVLTISEIVLDPLSESDFDLLLPQPISPAAPLRLAPGQSLALDLQFQPAAAGLRPGTILVTSDDADTPVARQTVLGTGLTNETSHSPPAESYVAFETPSVPNSPVLRGKTDEGGNFSFVLPPEVAFRAVLFDPARGLVSHATGTTNVSGQDTPIIFADGSPSTAPDDDGDGLPADVEFAIGTSRFESDTDQDGIGDGAELQQGLDPLSGRGFPLGVIGQLDLDGFAQSLSVVGSALNSQQQTAYLVHPTKLSIVDTSQVAQPILLGELNLPGLTNQDVDVDTQLQIAVVAGGNSGVHFVDVSDPLQPLLRQSVNTQATEVEVIGGTAYLIVGNRLDAVDVASGVTVQSLTVTPNNVVSLTSEGTLLFAMDGGKNLRAIDVSGPGMQLRGITQLDHGAGDVFVANGTAYATAVTFFRGGFSTVNVADPDNMIQISGPDATNTVGPSQVIAANGSGLALIGAGDDLDLMDVSDLENTNAFLTRFDLPGSVFDTVISAGVAMIAAGPAGLVITNYRAIDDLGVPPTVTIQSNAVDQDAATAGIQIVEGSTLQLSTTTSEDVQIRNVELLTDGVVVANDVSFPFHFSAIAPRLSGSQTSTRMQVRAYDTGGNSALSEELIFELVEDTEPPEVTFTSPEAGELSSRELISFVGFSERIDVSQLHPSGVSVVHFGADNTQGNGDDYPVRVGRVEPRNGNRTVAIYPAGPTPHGKYAVTIDPAIVRDPAGNSLAAPFSFEFSHRAASGEAPPVISQSVPRPGDELLDRPSTIEIHFDKPIVQPLDTNSIRLTADGEDNRFGTADDIRIAIESLAFTHGGSRLRITPAIPLPHDAIEVLLSADLVLDEFGNPLDGEFVEAFPTGTGRAGGDFRLPFSILPPRVIATAPIPGAIGATVDVVELTFDRPLQQALPAVTDFEVRGSGPDGRFDTADDTLVTIDSLNFNGSRDRVSLQLAQLLGAGEFRVSASTARLLDDNDVAVDGEFEFVLPSGDGNPGGTLQFQFEVVPPRVVFASPKPAGKTNPLDELRLLFDRPMRTDLVSASDTALVGSGEDSQFDTADDDVVAISSVAFDGDHQLNITTTEELPLGSYRLTVAALNLPDTAGNVLDGELFGNQLPSGNRLPGGDLQYSFEVVDEPLDPAAIAREVAAGGLRFVRKMVAPTNGLPYAEARQSELDADASSFAADFFVPAQVGNWFTVAVLAHAVRAALGEEFAEGFTDDELLDGIEPTVGTIKGLLETPGGHFHDQQTDSKALYQVHDTATGLPRQGDFARIVSLLDNVYLMAGLQVAHNYLESLLPQLTGDVAVRAAAIRDDIAGLLPEFNVLMWRSGSSFYLGTTNDPRGGAEIDRITSESRLAPVVALGRGELDPGSFDLLVDNLLSQSRSSQVAGIGVERIPFFGTAWESWAATPYISSELDTLYATNTLTPLANANIISSAIRRLPAAAATGVADGLGGFSQFGHSPAESIHSFLDKSVLTPPAAGIMLGGVPTPEAAENLGHLVASLRDADLMDPRYGVPNYQNFGSDLVDEDDPVRGTLEIEQMVIGILNQFLGAHFIEQVLRGSETWSGALDRYAGRLNVREAEFNVEGDGSRVDRENASGKSAWHLQDPGDAAVYTLDVAAPGNYFLSVRYSNNDTGDGDTVAVLIEGRPSTSFDTINTQDWELFTEAAAIPVSVDEPGELKVTLRLDATDGFGVDIDRLRLLQSGGVVGGTGATVAGPRIAWPDAPLSVEEQIVYLDFDGQDVVDFDGALSAISFSVPPFDAAAAGEPQFAWAEATASHLNQMFPTQGVRFVANEPTGKDFATVYVGGNGDQLQAWGDFLGVAEHIDLGNQDRSDKALVFSERIVQPAYSVEESIEALSHIIAHEVGHLLGYRHIGSGGHANELSELAYAVDNGHPAHQYLGVQGHKVFQRFFGPSDLDSFIGADEEYPDGNNALFTEGIYDEDINGQSPTDEGSIVGVFNSPTLNHFWSYNSTSFRRDFDDGFLVYDSLANRALKYISGGYGLTNEADSDWGEGSSPTNDVELGEGAVYLYQNDPSARGGAYYLLGHTAHLLQDATVPAHVLNDPHLEFPFIGVFDDPDPYHDWVDGIEFEPKLLPTSNRDAAFTDKTQERWKLWAARELADDQFGIGRQGHELVLEKMRTPQEIADLENDKLLFPSGSRADLKPFYKLFFETADATDDFDSLDRAGEVDKFTRGVCNSQPNCSNLDDVSYDNWTKAELNEIADQMVPTAIRATAELVRLFYSLADLESPEVEFDNLNNDDPDNPLVVNTFQFDIVARASDAQRGDSGVGEFILEYIERPTGQTDFGTWQTIDDLDVQRTDKTAIVSTTFEGQEGHTYGFRFTAADGGGHRSGEKQGQQTRDQFGEAALAYVQVGGVSVVEVLDRSESMKGSDLDAAKQAAQIFVELMKEGDQIGVVSYTTEAKVEFPLTQISAGDSEAIRNAAQQAINNINVGTATSIGAGMQQAAAELFFDGPNRAMIVLSDGKNNTSPDPLESKQAFADQGIEVFTIALGGDADVGLLSQIADEGNFYRAGDADALDDIYAKISSSTNGQQGQSGGEGELLPGQVQVETVSIDPSMSNVRFGVTSSANLRLMVVDPDGVRYNGRSANEREGFRATTGSGYEFLTIANATPGTWQVLIHGEGQEHAADYQLSVVGNTPIQASVSTQGHQYLNRFSGVPIQVSLHEGSQPITGGSVAVTIQPPPGAGYHSAFGELYDDGAHGDELAGDGIYGGRFEGTVADGVYEATIHAEGTAPSGISYSRMAEYSFVVAHGINAEETGRQEWSERLGGAFRYVEDPARSTSAYELGDFFLSWTNTHNALDTNRDQVVSAGDALTVINRLNQVGPGRLPDVRFQQAFVDANGDGFASPVDALMILNALSDQAEAERDSRQAFESAGTNGRLAHSGGPYVSQGTAPGSATSPQSKPPLAPLNGWHNRATDWWQLVGRDRHDLDDWRGQHDHPVGVEDLDFETSYRNAEEDELESLIKLLTEADRRSE